MVLPNPLDPAGQRPAVVALLCHPYHRGGVTTWMVNAGAEWRRRGHSTWFVAPRPRRPFINGRGRPAMVDLVEALPAPVRPTLVAPSVGAEFEFGTENYRAHIYAEAVSSSVPHGTPIIASDDAAAWRACAMLADRYPFIGVLHADDRVYYDYARRYARAVSGWACVSSRIATRLRALRFHTDAPAAMIPCGVPLPPVSSRRGGTGSTLKLVWVGRVDERAKRVSDLPRIGAELRRVGVPFFLDVLGDGGSLPTLREQVREAGLEDQVHLRGWCDAAQVAQALAAADVLLLPSNFEGMPVAAMEAMAAGCAVVASRVSGLEDFVSIPGARDCLWTHDVGDVTTAAASVRAAAAVPAQRRSAAARQLAEQEFAIERCVAKYERLFDELPSIGSRPASEPQLRPAAALWSRVLAASRVARIRLRGMSGDDSTLLSPRDTTRMVETSNAGA